MANNILLVTQDSAIEQLLSRILSQQDIDSQSCSPLELVDTDMSQSHCTTAVLDVSIPYDWLSLALKIIPNYGVSKVIILTALEKPEIDSILPQDLNFSYLQKPVTANEFIRTLSDT